LKPEIMAEIVEDAILENIDIDIYHLTKEREKKEKEKIADIINKL
jgi:hypothetical protein